MVAQRGQEDKPKQGGTAELSNENRYVKLLRP